MNKRIIIIVSAVVLAFVILLILAITKIIPIPFLDTNDLVCSRKNYNYDEVITFKFNWLSKSTFSKKVVYLHFESKEEADEYYKNYAMDDSSFVRENDTTMIINTPEENDKEHYKESRKKIKKLYTEFGFKCE